jgi:peptidoglycan/xylan/chitin deacetylase (PgdA/CDA1 family)
MLTTTTHPGALVISLDLELHWGVRDRRNLDRRERERLLLARTAALRIAELFEEFSVHATWAAVGFLFARSREDLERFAPSQRPRYEDPRLDPYREQTGRDESDDPFHFAPGLIDAIAARTGQEIATHSFSHFYCCESGQGPVEFEADLGSALAIAAESGYRIRSCVFPRNQVNPGYLPLLKRAGILCYRGNQASAANQAGSFRFQQRPHRRLLRLCDNYFDLYGSQTISWPSGPEPWCIGASRYLRPHNEFLRGLDDLRYRRIVHAMESAAARGELFHLWWHPEDFAPHLDRNLRFLRRILKAWERFRRQSGMLSLSMGEVVQATLVQGMNMAAGKVCATVGSSI